MSSTAAKSHYYQCPYCEAIDRKEDNLYRIAAAGSVVSGAARCKQCSSPFNLADIYYHGKYDIPVTDVFAGPEGRILIEELRRLAAEGFLTLSSEERALIAAQSSPESAAPPVEKICDITGKKEPAFEVPYAAYVIDQPQNKADAVEKLKAATPQYLKVGETLVSECRSAMIKRGQRPLLYFVLLLISWGVIMAVMPENYLAEDGSDAAATAFFAWLCISGFLLLRNLLVMLAFSVAPLTNPPEYVVRNVFLMDYLTQRSGKQKYYAEPQYKKLTGKK